jgi:prepilin-type N-terminal cleavage/methylation domain-containing protein
MSLFSLKYNRGMTLVELIIAIGIFSMLMLAITASVQSLYQYNSYAVSQAYQLDLARRGVETLTRDLREMIFADNGAFPLVRMEPHIVGFYSDVDGDNSVEYIEYELATTTTFTKRVYSATAGVYNYATPTEEYIVSDYVQNLLQGTSTFLYYGNNGVQSTSTADIADIRFIRSQIIVNVDAVRNPGEYMLRSGATLRNLKDNL